MRHLRIYSLLCVALLCVASCAKQGYPTGGPKDVTPPKAGTPQPPDGTLNFAANEFYIPFDEYVVVKDAENNILVSPPMKRKPEYVTKGRGLMVRIKDTLRPNTTYLFQFKGAVADLNEGNVLESFEYAFSTGSSLDTMCLKGRVVDGLSLQPREEQVTVMLYPQGPLHDSTVARDLPIYITRCDKRGDFAFNHIAAGAYRLVAIEDADKNLLYGSTEPIAFCDSLVHAVAMPATPLDTAKAAKPSPSDSAAAGLVLHMSVAEHQPQRLLKSDFLRRGRVQIVSQMPMLAPTITGADSLVIVPNAKGDTLNIWSRNEQCDSLQLVLSDPSGLQDTLKLRFRDKKKGRPAAASPLVRSLVRATHPYFDTLYLAFDNPIHTIVGADSLVEVLCLSDSTLQHCPLLLDSTALRARILFLPRQGERYRFRLPKGAIYDLYGHASDSLTFVVTMTRAEAYGNLTLHLTGCQGRTVVQLLSDKGEVLRQQSSDCGSDATFTHLDAGRYKVRAILDSNANGRWDAGDYYRALQPERVVVLPKALDLRANWDMDETFDLQ